MSATAIKVQGLSFKYENATDYSLKSFNLEVPEGSCTVILGPNRAGKSTLMSLICGLLPLNEGSISFPLYKNKQFYSYGTQSSALYSELSVRENLTFFSKLINPQLNPSEKISSLAEKLALGDYLDKKIAHCSGGIRQRTHIACTLLGKFPLLVLDEPFNNIDPESRLLIRDILKDYIVEHKATLLLSSHQFEAMENLWTHLAFIKNGKLSEFIEKDSSPQKEQKLQSIFFELKNAPLKDLNK